MAFDEPTLDYFLLFSNTLWDIWFFFSLYFLFYRILSLLVRSLYDMQLEGDVNLWSLILWLNSSLLSSFQIGLSALLFTNWFSSCFSSIILTFEIGTLVKVTLLASPVNFEGVLEMNLASSTGLYDFWERFNLLFILVWFMLARDVLKVLECLLSGGDLLLERTDNNRPFLARLRVSDCFLWVKKEVFFRFYRARFLITWTFEASDYTLKMYSNSFAGSCFDYLSEDISGLLDEASPKDVCIFPYDFSLSRANERFVLWRPKAIVAPLWIVLSSIPAPNL